MFIDIGAASREEAEKMVSPGDVAVYAPDFFDLGADMLAGPAMDNRVGCAVLIGMLKALKERNNEVVAVFTTQEEVGLRGATAAAYDVNPDLGIALDVTLTGDTPNGAKVAMKVGEGPCVKIMDRSLVCSPKVVSLMEEAAERVGVKYQREVLTAGGTDAGAIQLTRGGVHAGVLSIACRYVHSACEAVSISDIEGGVRLLADFADKKM
jgi:endoglucanase